MKIFVTTQSLRSVLRFAQFTLYAASIAMLSYCAFALLDARSFQQTEVIRFEEQRATKPVWDPTSIGRLEIPSLGVSTMIIEGTSHKTLRRGVGHISGTGLPGRPGNIGLSAHRDSFFRPLRNIKQNDIIQFSTPEADFRYRVISIKIVPPSDLTVLKPNGKEILTLVTCYPFYYVGPAPSRFIVRAARIEPGS